MATVKIDVDLNVLIDELHKSLLQQQTPADEPGRPVFAFVQDCLHPRDHDPAPNTSTPDFFKIFKDLINLIDLVFVKILNKLHGMNNHQCQIQNNFLFLCCYQLFYNRYIRSILKPMLAEVLVKL